MPSSRVKNGSEPNRSRSDAFERSKPSQTPASEQSGAGVFGFWLMLHDESAGYPGLCGLTWILAGINAEREPVLRPFVIVLKIRVRVAQFDRLDPDVSVEHFVTLALQFDATGSVRDSKSVVVATVDS